MDSSKIMPSSGKKPRKNVNEVIIVIWAAWVKRTPLSLTKSTFYYKFMWPEYVAFFLFRCRFHCKIPRPCSLKNGQSAPERAESPSWYRVWLCTGLSLPWEAATLPSRGSQAPKELLAEAWSMNVAAFNLPRPVWWWGYCLLLGLPCHIEQGGLMRTCGGITKNTFVCRNKNLYLEMAKKKNNQPTNSPPKTKHRNNHRNLMFPLSLPEFKNEVTLCNSLPPCRVL